MSILKKTKEILDGWVEVRANNKITEEPKDELGETIKRMEKKIKIMEEILKHNKKTGENTMNTIEEIGMISSSILSANDESFIKLLKLVAVMNKPELIIDILEAERAELRKCN